MKNTFHKLLALALAAVLLAGLGAQALAAPRGTEILCLLGTEPSDMLAAAGNRVQAGATTYYIDETDGCVYDSGAPYRPVLQGPAQRLNYAEGRLYYARPGAEAFSLCVWDLASGQETVLLRDFPGQPGQVWLVNGGSLLFSSGEEIWQLDLDRGNCRLLQTVKGLWSFVPTSCGLLWATGCLFDYTLYADGRLLVEHADDYTLRSDLGRSLVVYTKGGADLQLELAEAFAGTAEPTAFQGLPAEPLSPEEAAAQEAEDWWSTGPLWGDVSDGSPAALTAVLPGDAPRRALSSGVRNIVKRARQMLNVQWTPLENVGGWGYYDGSYDLRILYEAGKTYTGLPYGQPVSGWSGYVGSYVPWGTSLKQFVAAVNDPSSKMYTARSNYSRGSQYYGTDCSGFASWAWQTSGRKTCSGMIAVATRVGRSYTLIEVGDALINSRHAILVTDVTYNASGAIASISLSEANPTTSHNGCAYTTTYTGTSALESMNRSNFVNGSYTIYRNPNRDSVTYTHDCAVPLEGDVCELCGFGTGPIGPPDLNSGTTVPVGIDVSQHNGQINWEEVSKQVDFVLIRVGYTGNTEGGIYKDSQFVANLRGCRAYDIPYGLYYYAGATDELTAQAEADAVVGWLVEEGFNPMEQNGPPLPVFYDVEERNNILGLNYDQLLAVNTAFCSYIEQCGLQAGIYASTAVWNSRLYGSAYDSWAHWIAQWESSAMTANAGACIWQYSSDGDVDGVSTPVDMNYWIGGDVTNIWHPSTVETVSPDCGVDGLLTAHCVLHPEESPRTRILLAKPHDPGEPFIENEIPPTCTEYGMYDEVTLCALCGKEASRNPVTLDPLGHDLGEVTARTEPDCTTPGSETRHCARCQQDVTTELPALGHDFERGVCTRCQYEAQTAHEVFSDVRNKDYFAAAVLWAVKRGVTSGTGYRKFSPNDPCTREQVVTFLWAANGNPAPTGNRNPFRDVKKKHYFYNAVLWAVEHEVTSGVSETKFGVGQTCTRAQVVTFLWAAEGKPAPTDTENPFQDVKEKDWFCQAVLWARENGITSGVSATRFGANEPCTRAQVVTFLYAAFRSQRSTLNANSDPTVPVRHSTLNGR